MKTFLVNETNGTNEDTVSNVCTLCVCLIFAFQFHYLPIALSGDHCLLLAMRLSGILSYLATRRMCGSYTSNLDPDHKSN